MQGPLLEFAERCHLLGQIFSELGEVVVDRCCDVRRRIHEALPEVSVVQDFYHVKELCGLYQPIPITAMPFLQV